MPEVPRWAAYSALGVGVATLGAATVAALWPDEPLPLCRGWVDLNAPAQIRALAKPIEKLMNLKGFGDFLAGTAWIESRGNPNAGGDTGNLARGWFGIRPVSARVSDLGLSPSALKDPALSVALAAWYFHRCIRWAAPGQELDWLAFRRCWGYPKDVKRPDKTHYAPKFAEGLRCAGVDPNFMYEKAIRWNYQWPGVDALFAAVGRAA